MKYLYGLCISLLCLSCSGSAVDPEDNPVQLIEPIKDISTFYNNESISIDLSKVFTDADNDPIEFAAVSENNLLTPEINGTILKLSLKQHSLGSSEIIVVGKSKNTVATDSFTVSIVDHSAEIFKQAKENFKAERYTIAKDMFTYFLHHPADEVKAKAYAGLGFTYIRLENLEEAYTAFSKGLEFGITTSINDLKAGLCFLEYSYKKEYAKSIEYGTAVVTSDDGFKMTFDEKINIKDVRFTIARSYFDLNQYEKCLTEVQHLGKLFGTSPDDVNLKQLVLNALNSLMDELKN